eukprot:6525945-Pyramimonas_sp.AAC.1
MVFAGVIVQQSHDRLFELADLSAHCCLRLREAKGGTWQISLATPSSDALWNGCALAGAVDAGLGG